MFLLCVLIIIFNLQCVVRANTFYMQSHTFKVYLLKIMQL